MYGAQGHYDAAVDRSEQALAIARAIGDRTLEGKLLNNLGAESYHILNEINVTSAPLNSKIITDIIYFIFEDILNNKPVQNLKILTSGE